MSAEAERMRNEMVHTLKNLDKDMKLAKENLHKESQELAKLRGDEANALVNEVRVEGKNGLENHDVSMRNTATEEKKLKFKLEAGDEENGEGCARHHGHTTSGSQQQHTITRNATSKAGSAGERGRRERKWRESEKGEEERKKEGRGGAKGVRRKESEEVVEEAGQQKAEKVDQDVTDWQTVKRKRNQRTLPMTQGGKRVARQSRSSSRWMGSRSSRWMCR